MRNLFALLLLAAIQPAHAVYSSIGSQLDEPLNAPTGYQHVTQAGTLAGFLVGTAATAGDIIQGSTTVSPGSYALTIQADGDFSYAAGGDASKQTFQAWYYDVSAAGWSDAARVTVCVNNAAPRIAPGNYPFELSVLEDIAIATLDLNIDSIDDNGDAITVSTLSGTLPTGLSLASNDVTGTPTTVGISRTVQRHVDECGTEDALDLSRAWIIRPERPLFVGTVTNLSLTAGEAMTAVDYATQFSHDDLTPPAVTYSLKQLGSGSVTTLANGASTSGTALLVDDASTFDVGEYISTESNSTPVLIVGKYTNELELAEATSWADNDDITLYAVGNGAVTGLSLSAAGELTGTPTVVGSTSNLMVRDTDANSRIKDSDLFGISVSASGVGTVGGSGVRLPGLRMPGL